MVKLIIPSYVSSPSWADMVLHGSHEKVKKANFGFSMELWFTYIYKAK